MPKIENWSRDREREKKYGHIPYSWKHDEERRTHIEVQEGQEGAQMWDAYPGEYVVVLNTPIETRPLKHDGIGNNIRVFQTKEEAREAAVEWAKKSPHV